MDSYLPIVCIVLGLYSLLRNVMYMTNSDRLSKYVQTNRKAKFWVNTFGQEKAEAITKNFFLPLGIVVSLFILIMGISYFL